MTEHQPEAVRPGNRAYGPADAIAEFSLEKAIDDYGARLDAYARKLADEMSAMLPKGMHFEWQAMTSICEDEPE